MGRKVHAGNGALEIQDYAMSEKFGLDWREYDSKRVAYLLEIMAVCDERDRREAKKQQQNYGRKR